MKGEIKFIFNEKDNNTTELGLHINVYKESGFDDAMVMCCALRDFLNSDVVDDAVPTLLTNMLLHNVWPDERKLTESKAVNVHALIAMENVNSRRGLK